MRLRPLAIFIAATLIGGLLPTAAVRACQDGTPCRVAEQKGCCASKQAETAHCGSCPAPAGALIRSLEEACGAGGCRIDAARKGSQALPAVTVQLLPDLTLVPAEPFLLAQPEAVVVRFTERAHPLRAPPDRLFSPSRAPPSA